MLACRQQHQPHQLDYSAVEDAAIEAITKASEYGITHRALLDAPAIRSALAPLVEELKRHRYDADPSRVLDRCLQQLRADETIQLHNGRWSL